MIGPGATSQQENVLKAGVETISAHQTVTFTKYYRVILPMDGYLFWVNANILSGNSGEPNVPPLNTAMPNQPAMPNGPTRFYQPGAYSGNSAEPGVPEGNTAQFNQPQMFSPMGGTAHRPGTITVAGSLHYDIERHQITDQTYDINRVTFTSESAISDFDEVGPNCMFLGSFNIPDASEGVIRFSFDRRQNFYQQSDLFHYIGDAVYPDMETQIIDNLNGFDTRNVIVSNSLPIWLAFNQMAPPFPYPSRQNVPLYPSFLVPDGIQPPYGVINIPPDATEPLALAPTIDPFNGSHYQLSKDRVEITFLGLRNFNVQDFIDYVDVMAAQDNAPFGVMRQGLARDEKRFQNEISAIAMKKTVVYEVNYLQSRVRDVAEQFIKKVNVDYIIGAV
jgi:hypothetical protein